MKNSVVITKKHARRFLETYKKEAFTENSDNRKIWGLIHDIWPENSHNGEMTKYETSVFERYIPIAFGLNHQQIYNSPDTIKTFYEDYLKPYLKKDIVPTMTPEMHGRRLSGIKIDLTEWLIYAGYTQEQQKKYLKDLGFKVPEASTDVILGDERKAWFEEMKRRKNGDDKQKGGQNYNR